MAFGLVNGLLVTRLRINSFITTLATLGIGTGLALVVTGGQDVASVPPQLQKHFGVYRIGGAIPATVTVTAVVAVTLWFVATRTRFGLRSVALGSSRQAATRAGIRARRHLLRLFVLAGGCAGVASVMDFSRFNTTNIGGHQLDALQAIAGVVIGGGAIAGGAVSIGGAVLGALMAVLLESGLVILGLQPFYNQIVIGIVLLVAVYLRSRRDGAAGTEDERGGTEHARRFRRPSRPTD
jgi:ribose transport system permease protein